MENKYQRIVRVQTAGGPRWGVLGHQEDIYTLTGDPFGTWQRGERLGALDELTLLPPVAPSKIVCVGRNYAAHAAEHGADVPQEPLLFFKPPSSLVGPSAPIERPEQSQQVEYEGEMVVVMGRRCRNVSAEEAWNYVAGVTCGNDVTARDLQRRDNQWARAKGFDTFCPVGPWVVVGMSEDEVADLEVTCRVSGETRQRARTSDMVFSTAELIAYTSRIMTLEPGDILMTGTPAGVGPLEAGDVVAVTVERVGTISNPVC
jgi:2-keto-4-pentenoate hydratase/2-oxohepta-3-ene-1,7-dioic acid hydratase in catechol pathway